MKTFFQKLTSLYLILITAACAVFCTLFFIGRKDDNGGAPKNITVAEAKVMVNNACDQVGVKTKTSGTSISTQSIDYSDYFTDLKIDMNSPAMQIITPYYNLTLKAGKYLIDQDAKQNVWLEDKTSYEGSTNYFRWYIENNQVFIESTQSAAGTLEDTTGYPEYPHWYMIVLTKQNETEWKSEMYYSVITTVGYDENDNSISGVSFGNSIFETKSDNLWHVYFEGGAATKSGAKYFDGFENAEDVNCGIYEVNLQTNKVHDSFSTKENMQKLSNEEKLTVANRCVNYRNAQKLFYTSKNFKNAEKSDNLSKLINDYFE